MELDRYFKGGGRDLEPSEFKIRVADPGGTNSQISLISVTEPHTVEIGMTVTHITAARDQGSNIPDSTTVVNINNSKGILLPAKIIPVKKIINKIGVRYFTYFNNLLE